MKILLQKGTFLGGRYEILEHIGSGGMADVYKARCHKLNRYVAIKVLRREYCDNESFVRKFTVEAQSTAGLIHPNIVNIYDAGNEEGIHYIVMELAEGMTLKRYIRRYGRLSARETVDFAIQIASGLQAAHEHHIIHRDIKPQNILVSDSGTIKVTDFGIARAASSNTISSNVMGSVRYLSPEQARGGYADERSDIYSLGITIYEMATGKVPFDGKIISIRSKEIDAWAYAGNPIQWNKNYIYESLQTIRRGDWCFGIMHEIGHNFAPYISGATYAWNWNEEIFANFRMFYALEKLNAKVITTASVVQADGSFESQEKTYTGSELLQLYKSETDNCYDRTIGAGRAVEMGNALCYCLIRIKETYGWELYQDVFEELYSIPRDEEQEKNMNQWQKFEYFLSFLTKHAKADTNELFSKQELQVIKSYLSTQQ